MELEPHCPCKSHRSENTRSSGKGGMDSCLGCTLHGYSCSENVDPTGRWHFLRHCWDWLWYLNGSRYGVQQQWGGTHLLTTQWHRQAQVLHRARQRQQAQHPFDGSQQVGVRVTLLSQSCFVRQPPTEPVQQNICGVPEMGIRRVFGPLEVPTQTDVSFSRWLLPTPSHGFPETQSKFLFQH